MEYSWQKFMLSECSFQETEICVLFLEAVNSSPRGVAGGEASVIQKRPRTGCLLGWAASRMYELVQTHHSAFTTPSLATSVLSILILKQRHPNFVEIRNKSTEKICVVPKLVHFAVIQLNPPAGSEQRNAVGRSFALLSPNPGHKLRKWEFLEKQQLLRNNLGQGEAVAHDVVTSYRESPPLGGR